jgi:hypothetical protein
MRHQKAKTLPLGGISSGTLRSEDVVPELFSLADEVRMTRADRNRVRALQVEWDKITEDDSGTDSEIWYDVSDILDSYVPPYCYVGSIEGDEACIGVWLSQDSLDMARQDGEVWVDPDDGSEIPATANYRLVVSDHGNLTLYTRRGREIWGIV